MPSKVIVILLLTMVTMPPHRCGIADAAVVDGYDEEDDDDGAMVCAYQNNLQSRDRSDDDVYEEDVADDIVDNQHGGDVREPNVSTNESNFSRIPHNFDENNQLVNQRRRRHISGRGTLLGTVLPDNRTMRCALPHSGCYTWWKVETIDENTTLATVLRQGCWQLKGAICSKDVCVPTTKQTTQSFGETLWCCCTEPDCNSNFSIPFLPDVEEAAADLAVQSDPNSFGERNVLIMTICIGSAVIIGIVAAVVSFASRKSGSFPPKDGEAGSNEELKENFAPSMDLDNLKLVEMISRGRYATVWIGTLEEKDVAVKLYSTVSRSNYEKDIYRNMYLNEKEIYNCPFMDHSSILRLIGAEERLAVDTGRMECLLVMPYVAKKSLHEYLKTNILDWETFNRFCQNISRGVAHLHTDIRKGEKYKPALAHRDLNTRNILVQEDLNVVICDFGFAQKIYGCKIIKNGQLEVAENSVLADVGRLGTLRYMAPEVLDGAVNLRDCESSLKQIDIYALGLIFWEVAMRCSALFQSLKTPDYMLPFQKELGLHPTFEEMQMTVSKNKKRPRFPEVWRDNNLAVRALKETIEDCWDQDAEARLTALCIEERINEMGNLWDKQFGGNCSPTTINPTSNNPNIEQRISANLQILDYNRPVSGTSTIDRNGNVADSPVDARREQSVSESTVETYVSLSTPFDHTGRSTGSSSSGSQAPALRHQMMNSFMFQKNQPLLKPHHGRNLTMERNTLHVKPQRPVTVKGNTLVEGSSSSGDDDSFSPPLQVTSEMFHQIANNLESSLINSDILSNSNEPFIQSMPQVRPKQENKQSNSFHNQRPDSLNIRNPKRPNNAGTIRVINNDQYQNDNLKGRFLWWRKQGKDIYADLLGIKKSSPIPQSLNGNQNNAPVDPQPPVNQNNVLDNTSVKQIVGDHRTGRETLNHPQNHHQRSVSDGNSNVLKLITSPPRSNTRIPAGELEKQSNQATSTLIHNPVQTNFNRSKLPSHLLHKNLDENFHPKNKNVDASTSSVQRLSSTYATENKVNNLEAEGLQTRSSLRPFSSEDEDITKGVCDKKNDQTSESSSSRRNSSSCSSDTDASERNCSAVGRSESCRQATRPNTLSLKGHNFNKYLKHERGRTFMGSNPEMTRNALHRKDSYKILLPHHHRNGFTHHTKRGYLSSLKHLENAEAEKDNLERALSGRQGKETEKLSLSCVDIGPKRRESNHNHHHHHHHHHHQNHHHSNHLHHHHYLNREKKHILHDTANDAGLDTPPGAGVKMSTVKERSSPRNRNEALKGQSAKKSNEDVRVDNNESFSVITCL